MPPKPPVVGVVRLQMFHSIADQQASWSMFFANPALTEWNIGDVSVVANTAVASWTTRFKALTTTDVTFSRAEATDLTSDTAPQVIAPSGTTGSVAPPTVSNSVALHVEFIQGRRYRGGHPGVFIPGLPESNRADTRSWSLVTTEGILGAVTEFSADIQEAGYSFIGSPAQVAVSYFTGGLERVTPLVEPITHLSAQQRITSRRRRLGKGIYPEPT